MGPIDFSVRTAGRFSAGHRPPSRVAVLELRSSDLWPETSGVQACHLHPTTIVPLRMAADWRVLLCSFVRGAFAAALGPAPSDFFSALRVSCRCL
jgi:hypothetical protein